MTELYELKTEDIPVIIEYLAEISDDIVKACQDDNNPHVIDGHINIPGLLGDGFEQASSDENECKMMAYIVHIKIFKERLHAIDFNDAELVTLIYTAVEEYNNLYLETFPTETLH